MASRKVRAKIAKMIRNTDSAVRLPQAKSVRSPYEGGKSESILKGMLNSKQRRTIDRAKTNDKVRNYLKSTHSWNRLPKDYSGNASIARVKLRRATAGHDVANARKAQTKLRTPLYKALNERHGS